jgi:hypothetical protein
MIAQPPEPHLVGADDARREPAAISLSVLARTTI